MDLRVSATGMRNEKFQLGRHLSMRHVGPHNMHWSSGAMGLTVWIQLAAVCRKWVNIMAQGRQGNLTIHPNMARIPCTIHKNLRHYPTLQHHEPVFE